MTVRISWVGCLGLIAAIALFVAAMSWAGSVRAFDVGQCEVEPASQWAPQGYICPPIYGEGVASQWPGPGVARNDCVYPWTTCEPIKIEVVETGRWVEVRPTMWCMCWIGVNGPNGETARIVDLDPATVAALGLDSSRGLHRVRVYPAGGPAVSGPGVAPPSSSPATDGAAGTRLPQALPDTAMQKP